GGAPGPGAVLGDPAAADNSPASGGIWAFVGGDAPRLAGQVDYASFVPFKSLTRFNAVFTINYRFGRNTPADQALPPSRSPSQCDSGKERGVMKSLIFAVALAAAASPSFAFPVNPQAGRDLQAV